LEALDSETAAVHLSKIPRKCPNKGNCLLSSKTLVRQFYVHICEEEFKIFGY
jgi:hypothetical protein